MQTPPDVAALAAVPSDVSTAYATYWQAMTPPDDDHEARYRAWVFAYASIHQSWQANVKMYRLVLDEYGYQLHGKTSVAALGRRFQAAGIGLHAVRSEGLWRFTRDFWKAPAAFGRRPGESWAGCRDRLCERTFGIGRTKVSFALELCYPTTSQAVCMDRHMMRLYGYSHNDKLRDEVYRAIETSWLRASYGVSLPPAVARSVYWDRVQAKPNPRYWTHVLEPAGVTLPAGWE